MPTKSSKWRVCANPIDGRVMFAAYRIRDTSQPDHSGNRELGSEYMSNRQDALDIADRLNAEEGN